MSPPSLLLFTTSQSPLPIKFPRPNKPKLNLPSLLHRSLHSALDIEPISTSTISGTTIIPHPDSLIKHDVPPNHTHIDQRSDAETINSTSQPESGGKGSAKGDELESEITVKLHLIGQAPSQSRSKWIKEALNILKEFKGLTEVDTLLIGFKGIDYKGKRTAAADFFGCGAEGLTNDVSEHVSPEVAQGAREVWDGLKETVDGLDIKTVGTLYLPLEILKDLSESKFPPNVNSLDTPDCHSLPKEYTSFAKEKGIELWAGGGGEGSDPLPDADLHNLLNEFSGTIPLSSTSSGSANSVNGNGGSVGAALSQQIPLREDGLKYEETAQRGVAVRWVLGYTLVSKSRNVLKDKGYIVAADLLE